MKKKEKAVICLIFLAAILYSGVTYLAVSYTHLDVYKRQRQDSNKEYS